MTIQEAIRRMATAGTELYCKVCTVDAVDEKSRTADVTPLDGEAPLLGVNLQANQESAEGVVVFPAVGSYVVVAFIHASAGVVVLSEKVDKICLKVGGTSAEVTDGRVSIDGDVVINGGGLRGMVKVEELTDKMNALIRAFNNHTHEIPAGGVAVAGSATAQSNASPVMVPVISSVHGEVQVADFENEKVKH